MAYDSAGRLLTHYQGWIGETVQVGYDANGRRATRIGPFGETMVYTRDAQGRLTTLSTFAGNFAWTFDEGGLPTSLSRPNGTRTDYEFEGQGRISRIHHVNQSEQNLLDILYSYDSGGQITGQTEDTESITYGYDDAGQLTSADFTGLSLDWTYDLAGNRTSEVRNGNTTNYTVNAANELTAIGGATVRYDSAGNMVSKNNGTETFTWDEENRLTKHESGSVTVQLVYANDWRVIARIENGNVTQYAYDGDDFAGKHNLATGDTVRYVYSGERIDEVLAEVTGAGTTFPLSDHLGSVRGQTDPVGAWASRASYEPWGRLRSGAEQDLGFIARPQMTGDMLWLRWRQLNPGAGRFVSRDPIGMAGGTNQHSYAGNSPTTHKDPSGQFPLGSLGPLIDEVIQEIYDRLQQEGGSGLNSALIRAHVSRTVREALANDRRSGSGTIGGPGWPSEVNGVRSYFGWTFVWAPGPCDSTNVFVMPHAQIAEDDADEIMHWQI